jgi:hypothetical protein
MILFILTIIYLLGEVYTMSVLLQPIPEAIERWKKLLENNRGCKAEATITGAVVTILLFSTYYYLSSKYVNNIYFTIISMILAIYNIISLLPSIIYCNDTDRLIEMKCTKRNIIINRFKEVFIVLYVLIVFIKIFI